METGEGDFASQRVRLRKELLRRRRRVRARAYQAAVRRLKDAASLYAEELHGEGAAFVEEVHRLLAALPAPKER